MKILLLGATGQIGRRLVPKLLEDGHRLTALVRDLEKASDLGEQGVVLAKGNLECCFKDSLSEDFDALVFTAGSGGSTGKDKTLTVDLWGAIQAMRFCIQKETPRFIMISALKAQDPNQGSEAIKPYLVAKHAADEILKASNLAYTILRPGRLSDEPETGKIQAASQINDFSGVISRANVAECVRQCLSMPSTERKTIDLLDGDQPVQEALSQVNR